MLIRTLYIIIIKYITKTSSEWLRMLQKKYYNSDMKNRLYSLIIAAYLLIHLACCIISLEESLLESVIWMIITLTEGILLAYCLRKKDTERARIIEKVLCALLLVNSLTSAAILYLGNDEVNAERADAVIVLGHNLLNNELSETLQKRLDAALIIARENEECPIIVTGGYTGNSTITEAEAMRDYLVSNGIEAGRIIEEENAQDTIDNIRYSLDYLDDNDEVIIVSSRYHCLRAKLICSYYGLNAKAVGTDFPQLYIMNKLMHEKLGIAKFVLYYFMGLL